MLTFKTFLHESINDKGLFKAIFIVGLPGAGKSYTSKALSGNVAPRIVNTDQASEFIARKIGKKVSSETWDELFKDTSHRITSSRLEQYLNGMLPLFVDGTSNDTSNILHRMGILKSLGYDIGLVYVATNIDKAIERAKQRENDIQRSTDEEFIRKVASVIEDNVSYLKGEVSFFAEVRNDGTLDDAALSVIHRKVQGFFAKPLSNPIGKSHLNKLRENPKNKYLAPTILSQDVLAKKVQGWYKS